MIQLEKFVDGGVVGWWLTPSTYIQLTEAGSKKIVFLGSQDLVPITLLRRGLQNEIIEHLQIVLFIHLKLRFKG